MNVTVTPLGKVRFQAEARGHKLVCDQPLSNHGDDTGMTPPELFLSSLGTCAAYYALEYLRTRHLPEEGLRVAVEAEKAKGPARLGYFHVRVDLPALEDRHREGVLRAVKSCLIHNTLLHPPELAITVETPVTA